MIHLAPGSASNAKVSECSRGGRLGLGARVLLWGITLVLCILSLLLFRAPSPKEENAPVEEFSSARAFRHVEHIARVPHPRGSAALAEVRDYIVAQVRALGFEAELQRGTLSRKPGGEAVAVENVLVRVPGTVNSKAVLLCAHYDSVTSGPGAGDNGAAVASLIEMLRAIKSGPALLNDLILLFSDNEEYGSEGALLFIRQHPWFKDVGVVFNFDARGVRGPSIMFETSKGSGELVAEFAKGVPQIIAMSLSMEIYRRMPNGTDFTYFSENGAPGLNFAFIGGPEHYHKPTDNPATLDRGTLQHTGDYMVNLARHFGNLSLPVERGGEAVYFNVLGWWFVHYSEARVLPFGIGLGVGAIICLLLLARAGQLRVCRTLLAVLGFLLAAALAFGAGWLVFQQRKFLITYVHERHWLLVMAVVPSLLGTWLLSMLFSLWTRGLERLVAGVLVWTLLALLSVLLPAASYLFLWPALLGWFGLALWMSLDAQKRQLTRLMSLLLGPWTSLLLLAPLTVILWVAFPAALPVAMIFVALMAWPLLGAMEL